MVEMEDIAMLGKKIRYWAMCFVLGYIERGVLYEL